MKIINQNGYTREELFSWRVIVYRNIVESAQALAQAIADFNMTFESPENAVKNLPGTWQGKHVEIWLGKARNMPGKYWNIRYREIQNLSWIPSS